MAKRVCEEQSTGTASLERQARSANGRQGGGTDDVSGSKGRCIKSPREGKKKRKQAIGLQTAFTTRTDGRKSIGNAEERAQGGM